MALICRICLKLFFVKKGQKKTIRSTDGFDEYEIKFYLKGGTFVGCRFSCENFESILIGQKRGFYISVFFPISNIKDLSLALTPQFDFSSMRYYFVPNRYLQFFGL